MIHPRCTHHSQTMQQKNLAHWDNSSCHCMTCMTFMQPQPSLVSVTLNEANSRPKRRPMIDLSSASIPKIWFQTEVEKTKFQDCRVYGDSHRYGHGMGRGAGMNSHGPTGLWGFCEDFRTDVRLSGNALKRDKCRSRCLNFAKYSPVCNLFYWHLFFSIINEYTQHRPDTHAAKPLRA